MGEEEKKEEVQKEPQSSSGGSNVGMAILCYLGILILIPLVTEAKNDPFVKFHIGQGLALIIAWVISWVILIIPFLGWIVGAILYVILIILTIIGIINAATGKQSQLPIIGKFGSSFKV